MYPNKAVSTRGHECEDAWHANGPTWLGAVGPGRVGHRARRRNRLRTPVAVAARRAADYGTGQHGIGVVHDHGSYDFPTQGDRNRVAAQIVTGIGFLEGFDSVRVTFQGIAPLRVTRSLRNQLCTRVFRVSKYKLSICSCVEGVDVGAILGVRVTRPTKKAASLRPFSCGAAGNRTRVLRHSLKASPCAVRYASTRIS